MNTRRLIHKSVTAFLWFIFFALLMLYISICTGCTTIRFADEQGVKVYHPPTEYTGMTDEGPPASLNPPHRIVKRKDYFDNKGFWDAVRIACSRLEVQGYLIRKVLISTHDKDGLNWKAGDFDIAVIYYLEKEK